MKAQKSPYEVMVRYSDAGVLQGAHVRWLTIVTLDDNTTVRSISEPEPVDIGAGKGFPMLDLMEQVHVDALTRVDGLSTQLTDVQTQLNAAQDKISAMEEVSEKGW